MGYFWLRYLFVTVSIFLFPWASPHDMAVDAADRYDFSEYPLDHPLYVASNHKELRFFKDELNSVPMR